MYDYSDFPFETFTIKEIMLLAKESKDLGDDDFVKACLNAIRLGKHIREDKSKLEKQA